MDYSCPYNLLSAVTSDSVYQVIFSLGPLLPIRKWKDGASSLRSFCRQMSSMKLSHSGISQENKGIMYK